MNDDRLVGLKRQRPCQKRLSTRGGIVKLFENDCGAVDVSVPWPSFNLRRRVWRGLATVIHHHADCRQRCPTQHTTFQRHCEPLFPTGLRACRQSKAQQPHFCRWRTPRRREHGRHRPLTNPGRQRQCTLVRQRTVGNGRIGQNAPGVVIESRCAVRLFGTHFADPVVGTVVTTDRGYRFVTPADSTPPA
jgi:hypothetical protein